MKKMIYVTLILLMLAACAPQAHEQSLLPNDDSYANPDSYPNQDSYPNEEPAAERTPAEQAAITALSKTLNLPPGQITWISTEAVTWPDGCLGVQRMGVMCTQALVDGYKIMLEAGGQLYEYHTNQTGSSVALANDSATGDQLESTLITQLAENLGLEAAKISVVSNNPVEFGDACLGVAMQDVECAQVVTPGKIVVLEADGIQYEYHVSDDGQRVQPATLALTWRREGGIAGFCDSLTVFLSGEIYGNQCKSQPNGTMGTVASLLSPEERAQYNAWLKEYGQVNVDASDPVGVADQMRVTLELYGQGSGTATKPDEQLLVQWAQAVFQKLYQ